MTSMQAVCFLSSPCPQEPARRLNWATRYQIIQMAKKIKKKITYYQFFVNGFSYKNKNGRKLEKHKPNRDLLENANESTIQNNGY